MTSGAPAGRQESGRLSRHVVGPLAQKGYIYRPRRSECEEAEYRSFLENARTKSFCTAAAVLCAFIAALWTGVTQASGSQECGIASAHALATQAGCEVLKSGGNAFDAAVAVAAALAVVEPYASGIGGGGFFLLHRGADAFEVFVDARETAPVKATREFFLDENGQPRQKASLEGPTAAGIPGIPAALDWVAGQYGRLPLARALQPAIRLAEQGFPADARYVWATGYRESLLKADLNATRIFLDNGKAVGAGFVVKQPQLARTLRMLAGEGRQGFYRGDFARRLTEAVRAGGGLWELSDLESYRVVERPPVRFNYRGATITSAPLPSSGGMVLAQSLFILETVALATMSEAGRVHYTVEALRRAYHDRARYMGDPDFVAVPVERLASREYAKQRAASIDSDRATASATLADIADATEEGKDTTHFSVFDAEGNRVAATLSVNAPFGSGFIAGDTGVLLNNHMNDFSLAPSAPNIYRLVGNEANAVEGGKRPLSSMSPTFVEDERGVLVLGTPGGSRIISMVLEGILAFVGQPDFDLQRMVGAPRYHHQYLPDRIEIEPGAFSQQWITALRTKGHRVEEGRRRWGNMQAVYFDKKNGGVSSANDPRGQAGILF